MKKILSVLLLITLVFALGSCGLGSKDPAELAADGWKKVLAQNDDYVSGSYIHFNDIGSLVVGATNNVWDGTIYYEASNADGTVTDFYKYTIKSGSLEKVDMNKYMQAYSLAHGNDEPIVYRGNLQR